MLIQKAAAVCKVRPYIVVHLHHTWVRNLVLAGKTRLHTYVRRYVGTYVSVRSVRTFVCSIDVHCLCAIYMIQTYIHTYVMYIVHSRTVQLCATLVVPFLTFVILMLKMVGFQMCYFVFDPYRNSYVYLYIQEKKASFRGIIVGGGGIPLPPLCFLSGALLMIHRCTPQSRPR